MSGPVAQLALSIGGAALGASTGLPLGAQIGWLAGGLASQLLFPQKSTQVAAQIGDLKVTGMQPGRPIPYLQGHLRMAGDIWWASARRPIAHTTVSGGKGGAPTSTSTTWTYEVDLLLGLTDNEIAGITRIWVNDKLVWINIPTGDTGSTFAANGNIATDSASLLASLNTDKWRRMTVYTGAADQMPDPTYEAAVGTANAVAHRGRGSVFFEGFQLDESGVIPLIEVEACTKISAFDCTLSDAYALSGEKFALVTAMSPGDQSAFSTSDGKIWLVVQDGSGNAKIARLVNLADGSTVVEHTFSGTIQLAGLTFEQGVVVAENTGSAHEHYILSADGTLRDLSFTTLSNENIDRAIPRPLDASDSAVADFYLQFNDNYANGAETLQRWQVGVSRVVLANGGHVHKFWWGAERIADRIYYSSTSVAGGDGVNTFGYVDTTDDSLHVLKTWSGGGAGRGLVGVDGNLYVMSSDTGEANVLQKYDQDGNLLGSVALPGLSSTNYDKSHGFLNQQSDGSLWIQYPQAGNLQPYNIYAVDVSAMEARLTCTWTAEEYLIPPHDVSLKTMIYGLTGADYTRIKFTQPTTGLLDETLEDVVRRLLLRAGLTLAEFDVSQLATIVKPVRGIALTQIAPTRSALELLQSTHFWEMTVSDKLYCVPRGATAVATIPYADLGGVAEGGAPPEPFELHLASDIELTAQMFLTHMDIDADYQSKTQPSDRLLTTSQTTKEISVAMALTGPEAKAIVDTWLSDQRVALMTSKIALPGDYAKLEPTDPLIVTLKDGSTVRVRAAQATNDYPLHEFEVVADDVSVLAQNGLTAADYAPSVTVDPAVACVTRLMDIPILRDIDDDPGFYIAMKGDDAPWPGGVLYRSLDDVEYAPVDTVTESAVIGTCTTTLGDWTGARVFDEMNSVTVDIGAGTAASSTRAAMLADPTINVWRIGNEIVQVRDATLVSAGVYKLTGLIRGCRGTEWAMTGHAGSENCELLRMTGLRRIAMQSSELGTSYYYRAVTLGRRLSTATAQSFTDNGVGLKPFSPFDGRISRDGSNNATLTWQRRSRKSVRMTGALGISVPLGEDSEAYSVDIYSDNTYATVVRTISATATTASYTAAEQTADGLTPGNPIYWKVYQLSATVGRGYELKAAA